jgi:hypothetical protein
MLDTAHPQSVHIFHASRLLDEILTLSKHIISSPAAQRGVFRESGLPIFAQMRKLNVERFDGASFIAAAIDDFESAFNGLASETQARLDTIVPALNKLRSAKGFRTDFI